MTIVFPSNYGDRRIDVPDGLNVEVIPPQSPKSVDPSTAIDAALNSPMGTPSLVELVQDRLRAKQGGKVCIIVEDVTRHSPSHLVVPRILERLNQIGVPDDRIIVTVALGTHRPMTDREIELKVGREVFQRLDVRNSEFLDKERLTYLGALADYPLWLDRRTAEAAVRIGVGSVVPHPVAGWSGGAKIIIPGVSGQETVAGFHLSSHRFEENMFGKEMTSSRELMEELVAEIGLDFVVNTVYTPSGQVSAVTAGHFISAQRAAVHEAKKVYCTDFKEKADLVIVNSYPADSDFWQAGKAIHSGDLAAKDGGEVVLVTPSPEGIGPHPELPELFQRAAKNREHLLRDAIAGKVTDPIGASSAIMRSGTIMRRKRLGLVSEHLDSKVMEHLSFTSYASVEGILERALEKGPNFRVALITHGGFTVPMHNDS